MQSRSGELAMRPLPAVLLDLHEDLATGKLVLRRGKVHKTVDLVNGNPVSTASTPRDETLGHFLVNSGVISELQHRQAVERATTVGGKLGEALIAINVLTVEQLVEQLGRQARHKLVQALRWPQGAWRFDENHDPVAGMQLRMVEIVLEGLRETAVEDLGRLARLDGLSFELTARGKRLTYELRRAFGERAVTVLSLGGPIGDIEKCFPERAAGRIAIDAMLMCDAIVAKGAALGLGTAPAAPHETLLGMGAANDADELDTTIETPAVPAGEEQLYELLFDEAETHAPIAADTPAPAPAGAAPLDFEAELEFDDAWGMSPAEVASAQKTQTGRAASRKAVAAEHQRIQGADHYAVLLADRDAAADDLDAAYQVKLEMFQRATAGVTDPHDRARIDEVRAAYAQAHGVLMDKRKRGAYDRELAGGELVQVPPAIDTELNYRMAEELMGRAQWGQAVGLLRTVLARSPGEADYHAALGWAVWNAGGATEAAAGEARAALDQALSINPDHAGAHDYKGRLDAAVHADETTALFHLERAVDLEPTRIEAIAAIEELLVARGDLRRYERLLKRVLFRLRGRGGAVEAAPWAQLARLYLEQLDDPTSAAAAIANAKKLAPASAEVLAIAERLDKGAPPQGDPMRAGWREALGDPHSGAELVRSAAASGHADAAFLAASTMVALATADDAMAALYDRARVRTTALPKQALGRDQWALLRHKDDTVELGGLLELVAPAVHALSPMTLADGELDPSQKLSDAELPAPFAKLRAQLGGLIGVAPSPVYSRVELGAQLHVLATDPPVIVAGDDALTAPERPDLVFKLARAMSFLWPGRAVGASRPGRVLRAIVLAIVREAAGTELGKDDPLAARAEAAIATLVASSRTQARASALRLISRAGGGLNLSLWSRSLSRTADRAGLLLCGDVPAAFAGAREMGELDRDLVEFAFSGAHVTLRSQLGLSRA